MKIGLYDVDGHNFPNLPLMKISAWHKAQGDLDEIFEDIRRGKSKENCIGCWDCEITRPPQSWCYVEEL